MQSYVVSEGGLKHLGDDENHSTISWKYVDGSSIESMGLTSGVRKVIYLSMLLVAEQLNFSLANEWYMRLSCWGRLNLDLFL